jgi:hypothetical protein
MRPRPQGPLRLGNPRRPPLRDASVLPPVVGRDLTPGRSRAGVFLSPTLPFEREAPRTTREALSGARSQLRPLEGPSKPFGKTPLAEPAPRIAKGLCKPFGLLRPSQPPSVPPTALALARVTSLRLANALQAARAKGGHGPCPTRSATTSSGAERPCFPPHQPHQSPFKAPSKPHQGRSKAAARAFENP